MKLGDLEKTIMTHLWEQHPKGDFTVRDITREISARTKRTYAYNTILTVVTHLFEKKLLTRKLSGKTFQYRVKISKEAFISHVSKNILASLKKDYGSLAVSYFIDTLEDIDPKLLDRARKRKT